MGVTNAASGTQFLGVATQSDGEIVAAGQSGGQSTPSASPARLARVGRAYTGPAGAATGVAVQPDGKIVLGGTTNGSMFAERLTSAMALDGGLRAGGMPTAFGGSRRGHGFALGPGGTIVVAGSPSPAPVTPARRGALHLGRLARRFAGRHGWGCR